MVRSGAATVYNELGIVWATRGRLEEAAVVLRAALTMLEGNDLAPTPNKYIVYIYRSIHT
jgi:hypothetical protein